MQTWETIPEKGQLRILKNSNSNSFIIGKIHDYDLKNIGFGNWYDEDLIQSTDAGYKGPHERSATNIIKENQFSYLLLSDVEILNLNEKKDYYNKKLFKKL